MKSLACLTVALALLAGCSPYGTPVEGRYAGYNCNQLSMEQISLNDDLAQASAEEANKQVYQMALAAVAIANGDAYHSTQDTEKTDALKARLSDVRHEQIRKECNASADALPPA